MPANSPCGSTVESLWTIVNGWRVHTRAALNEAPANAPNVALVHGLVVSSRYMVPLVKLLAPDYRVFAPDLPGFGLSDKPDSTLSIAALADALCGWMDSVGLANPLLIGNSLGCQIVVDLTSRYPGRVRRSVLLGPTVDPEGRTMVQQAARWIRNASREPPAFGPILIRDLRRAGPLRAIQTLHDSVQDPVADKLASVSTPTLVVRGANDPIVPERWAREMTERLPNARMAEIPGVGHTVNYNAPLESARVARIFDEHPRYV